MSALGIFVTKPLEGCLDIESALPFPQNYLAAVALDTDVETTAAYSAQLDPYESLDYHDQFFSALFPLGLHHSRTC